MNKVLLFFLIVSSYPSNTTPCIALYGQCGGIGYTGLTQCCSPATCQYNNDYYSQCLTGVASTSSPTSTGTSSTGCNVLYSQCGGQNWPGSTCCVNSICAFINPYYSQCLSSSSSSTTQAPTSTTRPTTSSNRATGTTQGSTSSSRVATSTTRAYSATTQPSTTRASSTTAQSSTTRVSSATTQPSTTRASSVTTQPSTTRASLTTVRSSTTRPSSTTARSSTTRASSTTVRSSTTRASSATTQPSTTRASSVTTQPSTTRASSTTVRSSTTRPSSTTARSSTTRASSTTVRSSTTRASSVTTQPSATRVSSTTVRSSTTRVSSATTQPSTTRASTTRASSTTARSSTTRPSSATTQPSTTRASSTTARSSTTRPSSATTQPSTTRASSTTVQSSTTRPSSATTQPSTTIPTSTGQTCSATYGQCGGRTWTGPTRCCSGSVCQYSNDYYSQCIPIVESSTSSSSTIRQSTISTTNDGRVYGSTTRYWDCCKASCGWSGKATVSNPVKTCARDGIAPVDVNTQSVCTGGTAYMCNNQQPWNVSLQLSYGYAAAHISGLGESHWCCACYSLIFTTTSIAGKEMIVQVTNTGGDLGHNHFDLQMPGGGFGIFDGCTNQFGSSYSWGQRYGGISQRTECYNLPPPLRSGCFWRFDWFENADNPQMRFKQVACPTVLTTNTNCIRQ